MEAAASGAIPNGQDDSYVSNVNGVQLISLPRITDIRGSLTVGEFQNSAEFFKVVGEIAYLLCRIWTPNFPS